MLSPSLTSREQKCSRTVKQQVILHYCNVVPLFPLTSLQGKACFLCEDEHATRNLITAYECTACTPSVALPKQAQRVLEHMAAHILFDSSVERSSEPCGLCLRPTPVCVFHLKKGKGTGASEQVDFAKSACAKQIPFSYAVAAVSAPSSPSSNVPMHCPICPIIAPCVWRYNLPYHMRSKHPAISIMPYESLWLISNAEKCLIKEIWTSRHRQKKSRNSKNASDSGLVVSEAHSSCLVLRQVNMNYISRISLTSNNSDAEGDTASDTENDTEMSDLDNCETHRRHSWTMPDINDLEDSEDSYRNGGKGRNENSPTEQDLEYSSGDAQV